MSRQTLLSYPSYVLPVLAFVNDFGPPALVFFHFITALALIGLVLMHSGRDTGMAGMGYVPQSQGGTHIVERNLSRLTIVVGFVFFVNTVLLYHLLA